MDELILDENEDWEKRILCSDESCIGTIGPNGKCKECGKVYEGEIPEENGAGSIQTVATVTMEEQQPVLSTDTDCDDEWEKRVLCSDGCCIGVIGSDGKCKECGKPLN